MQVVVTVQLHQDGVVVILDGTHAVRLGDRGSDGGADIAQVTQEHIESFISFDDIVAVDCNREGVLFVECASEVQSCAGGDVIIIRQGGGAVSRCNGNAHSTFNRSCQCDREDKVSCTRGISLVSFDIVHP